MTTALSQFNYVNQIVEEIDGYAIIFLDTNGIITTWNKGAERIKGYTGSEIIGNHFSCFYGEEDRKGQLPQSLLNTAVRSGKAEHVGWRVKKDGSFFWGSVLITAIHDEEGDLIGFTKITRDLTAKKIQEEQQQKYLDELERRNREMEQLAYITSHDLQEPLRTIKGFINFLTDKESITADEETSMFLGFINESVERMHQLVRAILEYSLLGNNKTSEPIDCNELLANICSDLAATIDQKGAIIEYHNLPAIKGYPAEIRQLFQNLINNSLKFSRPGVPPHVTLSARAVQSGYWEFTCADNGIGISSNQFENIFRLFRRLHLPEEYPGTGIGLAYVKKIAELHNGQVWVESEPGQGTVFYFTLPGIFPNIHL